MAVRKGDQDQGKLKVIDASKNLLRYTYERVKSKTFPKAERWLMPKSIWDQVSAAHYYYTTKAGIKNGNYERAASEG